MYVSYNGIMLLWRTRRYPTCWIVESEHFSDFMHHKEIACELDFNRWVGSILLFLLSAHHLIDAYFLTTKGDQRMRLLTRLYGIVLVC